MGLGGSRAQVSVLAACVHPLDPDRGIFCEGSSCRHDLEEGGVCICRK